MGLWSHLLMSVGPRSMTYQNSVARIDSGESLQHGVCCNFDRKLDGDRVCHQQ